MPVDYKIPGVLAKILVSMLPLANLGGKR